MRVCLLTGGGGECAPAGGSLSCPVPLRLGPRTPCWQQLRLGPILAPSVPLSPRPVPGGGYRAGTGQAAGADATSATWVGLRTAIRLTTIRLTTICLTPHNHPLRVLAALRPVQEYFERAAAVYIDVDGPGPSGGGLLAGGPSKAAYEDAGGPAGRALRCPRLPSPGGQPFGASCRRHGTTNVWKLLC